MKNITLKQLRYAIALADHGHFSRAAAQCHITQPALSQQIRLLEDGCQSPLFERIGRKAIRTPFGHEFLARARTIIQETEALLVFAQNQLDHPTLPIKIGLIPTIAPYLLPQIYPALADKFLHMPFVMSEGQTDVLLSQLTSGLLDLALIATEPPENARLTKIDLFADPFVLATDLTFKTEGPVHLSEHPPERMLLLDEGHCFRDQAIAACALRGPETTRAFAATSLSTIVEIVANGQGITLLPAISLEKETKDRRINIHQLAAPGSSRTLQLAWRQNSPFQKVYLEIAQAIKIAGQSGLSTKIDRAAT